MSDRPGGGGWKRAVERLAVSGGAAALGRLIQRGRTLVLAYHNIVPDEDARTGDPSLHLAVSDFVSQLDYLAGRFEVVGLRDLDRGDSGGRPRVILSFDDAYLGAVTHGLPEVVRRGWPATLFVAPGCLGAESLWWDRCAGLAGWNEGLRERLLHERAGRDRDIAAWAAGAGLHAPRLSRWHRIATEADLDVAAKLPGLTLGAHTWSHPNLAALPAADLAGELGRPLEWLRRRFPNTAPWLAYPYGLVSAPAVGAARDAGYAGAFLVSGGWLARSGFESHRLTLPRLNVPAGISIAGFALRVAGWLSR